MTPVKFFSFPGNYPSFDCILTLRASGPMKAGINDANRSRVFTSLGIDLAQTVSLTQTHSRRVLVSSSDTHSGYPEGDGILTVNPATIPCVTVADCMPIWLFNRKTGCFGVLHSGWKGTGILQEALVCAKEEWGAQSQDFLVILGPHIRSCCYTVDEQRARYFSETFGPSCVVLDEALMASASPWSWRLSLSEANRLIALEAGIPADQVLDTALCTACSTEFGSCRREGSENFTHMAAFIRPRVH